MKVLTIQDLPEVKKITKKAFKEVLKVSEIHLSGDYFTSLYNVANTLILNKDHKPSLEYFRKFVKIDSDGDIVFESKTGKQQTVLLSGRDVKVYHIENSSKYMISTNVIDTDYVFALDMR